MVDGNLAEFSKNKILGFFSIAANAKQARPVRPRICFDQLWQLYKQQEARLQYNIYDTRTTSKTTTTTTTTTTRTRTTTTTLPLLSFVSFFLDNR